MRVEKSFRRSLLKYGLVQRRQQNFLYLQYLSSNGTFSCPAKHANRANNRSLFDLSGLWNEIGWACRTSRIFTVRFPARRPTTAQTHSLLTSRMPENVASPSRSTTTSLDGKTAQKKPAYSYRKTAAPPSESTLPRPESWALRRLVYSPSATLPPSYESLRHCLQLRQNSPACAPCLRVLSFPCHCPSVVGFSSPVMTTVA